MTTWPKTSVLFLAIISVSSIAFADLEPLSEESLSETTGEGIALLPENIKIVFDSDAYVKTLVSSTAPAFGKKAELIWYGVALTGADGNVTGRVGNAIASWGTASNPWVLKVETLSKIKYDGSTAGVPVMSYYAPTYALNDGGLKYAFWADLLARDNTTSALITDGKLQTQSIWNDVTLNGSRFSIFQSTVDYTDSAHVTVGSTATGSFGAAWLNRINSTTTGQFRFSVAESSQTANAKTAAPVLLADVPTFNNVEGMYVTNFDMNMVVGNLHYQPLIVGAVSPTTQNFQIELVRIPNTPAVYNEFYRDYTDASQNYKGCTNTTVDCSRATHSELSADKFEFKSPTGTVVDLGSAKFDGLMIQHLKIQTLGL